MYNLVKPLPVSKIEESITDVGFMRISKFFGSLLALIAICSLCGACCSTSFSKPTGPQMAKSMDDMSVALVYSNPDRHDGTTFPFCSGVWVSKDVILTAGHCVEGLANMIDEDKNPSQTSSLEEMIKKMLQGDDKGTNDDDSDDDDSAEEAPPTSPIGLSVSFIMPNEVTDLAKEPSAIHKSVSFAWYKHQDVALLRAVNPASVPSHGIAELADKLPARGEQVFFDGHQGMMYWSFMTGYVAAYRKDMSAYVEGTQAENITGPMMQVSAPIFHGNSGGGVFNDRGELTALVSYLGLGPDIAFCVPLPTLRGVLQGQHVIPTVIDVTKVPDEPVDATTVEKE